MFLRKRTTSVPLFQITCLTLSFFFVLGILWHGWRILHLPTEIETSYHRVPAVPLTLPTTTVPQSPPASTPSSSIVSDPVTTTENVSVPSDVVVPHVSSTPSSSSSDIPKDSHSSTTTDGVPSRMTLAVPFTSQAPEKNWSQPWQDACEEAAILMMDAYYNGYGLSTLFAKDQIIAMVEWEEKEGWGYSISLEQIKTLAETVLHLNRHGTLRIVEDPTIEQIKKFIANKQPVLVVADGKVLPNPHFRNGGPAYHALVIRGYTEDSFITNDPGTQFGENFSYTYNDLMKSIRDWNDGNVKKGKRVIMVVE